MNHLLEEDNVKQKKQVVRYVTRWALTTGVREVLGEYTEDGKYFSARGLFVSEKEVFPGLSEARIAARAMARKKSDSLRAMADKYDDPNWSPKVILRLERRAQ